MKQIRYKIKIAVACFSVIIPMSAILSTACCQSSGDTLPVIVKTSDSTYVINNKVELNTEKRTISFAAKFNRTEGMIEVILCTKSGKTHESLITTEVSAIELQTALLLSGFKSLGNKIPRKIKNFGKKKNISKADSLHLFAVWTDSAGNHSKNIGNFIWSARNKTALTNASWFFNGLLTGENGKILSNNEFSLIAANYDAYSVLALKTIKEINFQKAGIHINSASEDTFFATADAKFAGREIRLVIKPAFCKEKMKK